MGEGHNELEIFTLPFTWILGSVPGLKSISAFFSAASKSFPAEDPDPVSRLGGVHTPPTGSGFALHGALRSVTRMTSQFFATL